MHLFYTQEIKSDYFALPERGKTLFEGSQVEEE